MVQQTKIILTTYGNNQILSAIASGTQVLISAMVYGDGGGHSYVPQPSQESLVNQLGKLTNLSKQFDEDDGFIYFSSTIPANTPAFVMREVGLIDNFGKLIALGVIPDTSKPAQEEGLEVSLPISLGFKTSTGEVMIIYVDMGDGYPDKTWVINYVASINQISGVNW